MDSSSIADFKFWSVCLKPKSRILTLKTRSLCQISRENWVQYFNRWAMSDNIDSTPNRSKNRRLYLEIPLRKVENLTSSVKKSTTPPILNTTQR